MSTAQQRQLAQAPDPAAGSVASRCQALGLARSSFYYQPEAESALNLLLMRLLDEAFTLITSRACAAYATTCAWLATSLTKNACGGWYA